MSNTQPLEVNTGLLASPTYAALEAPQPPLFDGTALPEVGEPTVDEGVVTDTDVHGEAAPSANALAESPDADNQETTSQPGRLKRTVEWMRNNKAVTAAGVITVAGVVANPMSSTVDALDPRVARDVLISMAAAEVAWIGGLAVALQAAGMKFTLNPFKLRKSIQSLSRDAVKENKGTFDGGMAINTTGAVLEVGVPTAAIVGTMPPSLWGAALFLLPDLWATYVIRRKVYSHVKQPAI